jgi:hypothetical protein
MKDPKLIKQPETEIKETPFEEGIILDTDEEYRGLMRVLWENDVATFSIYKDEENEVCLLNFELFSWMDFMDKSFKTKLMEAYTFVEDECSVELTTMEDDDEGKLLWGTVIIVPEDLMDVFEHMVRETFKQCK